MIIALAQINPTIGDISRNSAKILQFINDAKAKGAQLVVFPELALVGYPPKDLLLKPQFVQDNLDALVRIAEQVHGIDAIVGYVDRNDEPVGRACHNAAALLREGRIVSRHLKTLLPTYDVFDERRYFEPGHPHERANVINVNGSKIGLSICEDLWNDERMISRRLYHENPIHHLHLAGAQMMVNTSASPYVMGKHEFRIKLFASQVQQFKVPLVYVNQVGGNDELVFDGSSMVLNANGEVIAQAGDFKEELLIVDMNAPEKTQRGTVRTGMASLCAALELGLVDYAGKCGFKSVVMGLSGGIDSALTAAIAVRALGKDKVTGVAMPSRYSSDHSVNDARKLAENLGIQFHVVPIKEMHDAYEKSLAGAFAGREPDVTEENLQARIRGGLLMAFSNKFNHLLLTTGNKSEMAVGYCTLYGDMCGGLNLISDVPKTMVYELSEWINAQTGYDVIPNNTIHKAPSAELRPNQTDQDSLPPYPILDAILLRYVEEEKSVADIIRDGFDPATVVRVIKLVDRSEYKRRQAAPGLKVTSRAFGFGRRMPMAQNYVQAMPDKAIPTAPRTSVDAGWGYEPAGD